MPPYRQLHLPARIGLGYAIAIASMILMLLISIGAFQIARQETARVHDNYIPSLHIAKAMQVRLERMENAEFMYFVSGQVPARWMSEFDRAGREFEQFFANAEAVSISPEEREIYAAIGRHYGGFVQIDRQMRQLLRDGRLKEAQQLNNTESIELASRLRERTRAFYEFNLLETQRARATEDGVFTLAMTLATAAGLLGTLFAAWWWRRASSDIVAPLRDLQAASSSLADGKTGLAHHPAAAKTAELAALQADFNHMAITLQQTTDRLRTANSTLEDQVAARTQDLSEANRKLQAMVAELQTVDKLKSDFMAVMSHELLTPINFITGFGSALEDGVLGPLTADQEEAVQAMMDGATRLTRMVRNTLEYTLLEADKLPIHPDAFEPVELVALAEERLAPAASDKHQRLIVEVPESLPAIWADPHRVDQVLQELLDNAVKFTGEGHKIRLSARATEDAVEFEVADTGQGIPADALAMLGKPFFQVDGTSTRRHGGMGLGLALVFGLVKRMGGTLRVSSRVGQGTTFRIRLPRADRRAEAETPRLAVEWQA